MTWPIKKLGKVFHRLLTRKLQVPFVYQINDNACGAAVLEMIYRYYGINNIDQRGIFNQYREIEPALGKELRIATDSLIRDAANRGFQADWDRADYEKRDKSIELLKNFVNDGIPIIVCQQFTKEQPLIGHFRVVVGIGGGTIYLHDPHPKYGGRSLKWSLDQFMDFWQPTGPNVTGGVYIVIRK